MTGRRVSKILFPLFLLITISASGQATLEFDRFEHDFGIISYSDSLVQTEFTFVNRTAKAIRIDSLVAECQCTVPEASGLEIQAGDTASVTVSFIAYNYPGSFSKDLFIWFSSGPLPYKFTIKGFVEPVDLDSGDYFDYKSGNLLMTSNHWNLGQVSELEIISRKFRIKNTGSEPIRFLSNHELPPYLQVRVIPETIQPNELGAVEVTYSGRLHKEYGYRIEPVWLLTDDDINPKKKVSVSVSVVPAVVVVNKDDEQPNIIIGYSANDFPDVVQGDTTSLRLFIQNTGGKNLKIYKVEGNCTCLWFNIGQTEIPPGEQQELIVSFDTSGFLGKEYKQVILYSNDPREPVKSLLLSATIEKAE